MASIITGHEQEQLEKANDNGWREVADTALAFVQRFVKA